MNTLLLLEDDFSLVDGLVYSLKKNDYSVEVARTVQEALTLLPELDRFDLLILDVTLPDGTGFDVCEAVRRQNVTIPILFLTASDEEVNVIRGLDCGGDDYITKPFKLGELCSRIRALLRRSGLQKQPRSDILRSGPVSIDTQIREQSTGELAWMDRPQFFPASDGYTLTKCYRPQNCRCYPTEDP